MAQMTSHYTSDILRLYDEGLDLGQLTGKSIIIAGATGLVGSALVDVLMLNPERDYRVIAVGRNRKRAEEKFEIYKKDPGFSFAEADITLPLGNAIGTGRTDYIIDAASNASPNFFRQKPVEVMKANINGVSNLLEHGLRHGLRRMVYISSGEIYGEGDGTPFTETSSGYVDCATARACYPSSKRAAETLCIAYGEEYDADVVIARLSHTYGPGFTESDDRVYAQFIRNVMKGEDIVLRSQGCQYRSWLYVVDAAHAILRLLMDGTRNNAYNVAHPESNISIRQLAELIAEKAHRKVVFSISNDPAQGNTTPITKATFSIDKLKALGWHPLFSIDEGIEHTIQACKPTYF